VKFIPEFKTISTSMPENYLRGMVPVVRTPGNSACGKNMEKQSPHARPGGGVCYDNGYSKSESDSGSVQMEYIGSE